MKSVIKSIVFTVLSVSVMIIIFLFSSQTGDESREMSDQVRAVLEAIILNVMGAGELQERVFGTLELLLRKGAHAFLYALLGLFVAAALDSYGVKKNRFLITIVFCFFYAVSDETHQYFVDGRNAAFTDVIIDTIGACAGYYVFYLFTKITSACTPAKNPPAHV